ncbi:MAG: hypothetical protein U9R74_13330 [Pseudomonadota bacterium]|nr:hypothetical protein [Pseudomonadota bacterium]
MKVKQCLVGLTAAAVFAAQSASANPVDTSPVVLTDSEMDFITAGAIEVKVLAGAAALGEITLTATRTDAITESSETLELGFAIGSGYACCGPETYTDVIADGNADGDIVIVNRRNIEVRTPVSSREQGFVVVGSMDVPEGATAKQIRRMTKELRREMHRFARKHRRIHRLEFRRTLRQARRELRAQL